MVADATDLVSLIHRRGPVPFDVFVEAALYAPGSGFFERGRGAGRGHHDFVTSPEVGPLFGTLVARALDGWWDELARPDPYVVVDVGAGRGRLAADVLAAAPRCERALRLVLVERSGALRDAQRELLGLEPVEHALGPSAPSGDGDEPPVRIEGVGPIATALPELPGAQLTGVVLANELLDNLPFRVVERVATGWAEVRVGHDGAGFVEVLVPAPPEVAVEADAVLEGISELPVGARVPVPTGARDWIRACAATLRRGRLVVVDYAADAGELVARGESGWLRTFREHRRGGSPLEAVGAQDVTIDLPVGYLIRVAAHAGLELVRDTTQAEWLGSLGIDALVAEARAGWDARAHVGDLDALRHRSRVGEAAALVAPDGLGAHRVLVFAA